MAGEWADSELGNLVRLQRGHDLTDSQRKPGTVPVMGSAGQNGFHDTSKAKGPGIVLGRSGASFGKVHYTPDDYWPHNTALYVTDFQENDELFTYYFLRTIDFTSYNTGSAQPSLNRNHLYSIPVNTPPLPEQKAIAHVLGSLDDKIELNRRMNETLEGMAQALFKSWFVDFDPVIDNALAAGNPIPEPLFQRAETRRQALANGTANRETAQAFPASFRFTEELGWIPECWEVKALDQIADYKNGLAFQKFRPSSDETPLPIVKIAQLKSGMATWDEVASPNITPECIVNDGDVVFSWSGSLMIDIWCGGKAALNQHLFKVTSSDFPKWFYYHWSNEHLLNFQRIAADKAVTMGHIKRSHLSEAYCAIPNEDILSDVSGVITPPSEKITQHRIQNRTLAKLRDVLLPKLISGELRIPQAEKMVEEAVA
jgi:type I restriction enzyme S subunit